jgi:hypothetical protein
VARVVEMEVAAAGGEQLRHREAGVALPAGILDLGRPPKPRGREQGPDAERDDDGDDRAAGRQGAASACI